jgi:hypothetical protein
VALLRSALMETVKDKRFLADADKAQLDISPVPGDKLQAMVADIVSTPKPIVEKYKAAVSRTN